jgi:hypothetical protein
MDLTSNAPTKIAGSGWRILAIAVPGGRFQPACKALNISGCNDCGRDFVRRNALRANELAQS